VWIVLAGKPPKKRRSGCADDISTLVGVQIPPVHYNIISTDSQSSMRFLGVAKLRKEKNRQL
jgi:hypothetical protein